MTMAFSPQWAMVIGHNPLHLQNCVERSVGLQVGTVDGQMDMTDRITFLTNAVGNKAAGLGSEPLACWKYVCKQGSSLLRQHVTRSTSWLLMPVSPWLSVKQWLDQLRDSSKKHIYQRKICPACEPLRAESFRGLYHLPPNGWPCIGTLLGAVSWDPGLAPSICYDFHF